MTAVVSRSMSAGEVRSRPSPPMASESSVAHGTVFSAGADSWVRSFFSGGSGILSATCWDFGIASIMLTATMVSSSVLSRSFSRVDAVLSQATATRAPWFWNSPSSSWAV